MEFLEFSFDWATRGWMNEKAEFENTNGLQTRYDEIGGPAKHGKHPDSTSILSATLLAILLDFGQRN